MKQDPVGRKEVFVTLNIKSPCQPQESAIILF